MSIRVALFLSLVLLSSTQIISLSNSTSASASSNLTYSEYELNLTILNGTKQDQVNNCLALLNDTNIFLFGFQLAAGIERLYSDGYKEYYLYIYTFDSNGNAHEFEAVVSIDAQGSPYVLQKITEIALINTTLDSNNTEPVTQSIITQTTQSAKSLPQLYASIAQGFNQRSQDDIKTDTSLAALEAILSRDYSTVSKAQQAAVYTKLTGLATSYLIFYESGTKPTTAYSVYAVVDNIKKVHYILSVNTVDTSSVKAN